MQLGKNVAIDPKFGFHHLDPIPSGAELDQWYREKYYSLVEAGGRAPELRRFLEGGETAKQEVAWLEKTLWQDIVVVLRSHLSNGRPQRVLDFGCGTGHFLNFCRQQTDWILEGIEPAAQAAGLAAGLGFPIYDSAEECMADRAGSYDAVVLLNVLEHVPKPCEYVERVTTLLSSEGIIVIRVPNDFSEIQQCAQESLGVAPWWVAPPDHINYFDFQSLQRMLNGYGFQMIDTLADFPMEMFLLFGDNYIENPEVGSACHKKRTRFDNSLPGDLRRTLYRSFAQAGIGRNSLVFGKRRLAEA